MRKDMHELLVERPRSGMRTRGKPRRLSWERKSKSRDGDESLPARMPMGWKKTKYLNENLKPLVRYLRGQVNRPWDVVYSDMRSQIDADSVVKRHILEHLDGFVLFATREGARTLLLSRRGVRPFDGAPELLAHGFIRGRRTWHVDGTLYVSLKGILMYAPRKKHVE
jgi:hypothetical protein